MRVNVDSAALTDPRIRRLGLRLGKPWREAFGHLISVWMLCYDRKTNTVSCEDVDIASECEGFANAMVAADLGVLRGGKIRVRGVDDRIGFLIRQKERAVKGGRPKNPRDIESEPQGLSPDIPTVVEIKPNSPALAPDLSPALDLDLFKSATPRAAPDRPAKKTRSIPIPESWAPSGAHRKLGVELGVEVLAAADKFRDWALAKGEKKIDWDAAFRNWLRTANDFVRIKPQSSTQNQINQGPAYRRTVDEPYIAPLDDRVIDRVNAMLEARAEAAEQRTRFNERES